MSRRDNIIAELEEDYGAELDSNFDLSILCDGDTCRHSGCECWDEFRNAVENHLDNQVNESRNEMERMYALYKGEVNAGIHKPEGEE